MLAPYNLLLAAPLSGDECYLDDRQIDGGTQIGSSATEAVITAAECQELCVNVTSCLFFTWGSRSAGAGDVETCAIYSAAATSDLKTVTGYVSGPKYCELETPDQNSTNLVDVRK